MANNVNRFSIPIWGFDNKTNQWSPKQFQQVNKINRCDAFQVITYNIWFANDYQSIRCDSLCSLLQKSYAQIIGLQEVTKPVLNHLLSQGFIKERYYLSDINGSTFKHWYGVVLLIDIRFHVTNLNLIDFPTSQMGRQLIIADIKLNASELVRVGTVHLESLNNKKERQNQLEICQYEFNRFPGSSILMGDFNFGASSQENHDKFSRLPQWIDIWNSLSNSNDVGYTFDTEKNEMAKFHNRSNDQSRYDRVILRSETLHPIQIEIIGDAPVARQGQLNLFISDHFGLSAYFQTKSEKINDSKY